MEDVLLTVAACECERQTAVESKTPRSIKASCADGNTWRCWSAHYAMTISTPRGGVPPSLAWGACSTPDVAVLEVGRDGAGPSPSPRFATLDYDSCASATRPRPRSAAGSNTAPVSPRCTAAVNPDPP